MASASSIRRLHAVNNLSPQGDTQPAPVKSDTVSDSQPSLMDLYQRSLLTTRPRRFALPGGETRFDGPALMSTMHASAPPDQAGRFAELSTRETVTQARAALVRRMERQARGGGAIDHGVRVQI